MLGTYDSQLFLLIMWYHVRKLWSQWPCEMRHWIGHPFFFSRYSQHHGCCEGNFTKLFDKEGFSLFSMAIRMKTRECGRMVWNFSCILLVKKEMLYVLVVTCWSPQVAFVMITPKPHELTCLSEDDSRQLFFRKAFSNGVKEPTELVALVEVLSINAGAASCYQDDWWLNAL